MKVQSKNCLFKRIVSCFVTERTSLAIIVIPTPHNRIKMISSWIPMKIDVTSQTEKAWTEIQKIDHFNVGNLFFMYRNLC